MCSSNHNWLSSNRNGAFRLAMAIPHVFPMDARICLQVLGSGNPPLGSYQNEPTCAQ